MARSITLTWVSAPRCACGAQPASRGLRDMPGNVAEWTWERETPIPTIGGEPTEKLPAGMRANPSAHLPEQPSPASHSPFTTTGNRASLPLSSPS